jgi:Toxin co-regulated pilus biosynthesis protein Q
MYKNRFAWLLLLLSGLTTTHAQNNEERDKRLTLEIEWVRSPRAVLNVDAAPKASINVAGAVPYATPVEIKANLGTPKEPTIWSLEPAEKRLSVAMTRWAQQAGWQLVWEADRDFLIESNLHLSGDFLKSVGMVMQSLADTDYPLQAKANSATLTLRINRYQDAGSR